MKEIDFAKIEKKWQGKWDKAKVFEVEDKGKNPYYVLEMFAYPSGTGLHMGHAFNFVIGDILARFKIMEGFNVLHPVGYDSLGLPAENAAIKVGTHPADYTNKSILNFMKQQKGLGLSYDWSRMINTADASYYKWDQWIFLKMLEKGLAYQKESAVNWCPKCNTVLANEQVVDGKCWIHDDTEVESRKLKQWFLRTTAYADELYEGLDKLTEWPEKTKVMQRNWIGKSHGMEIDFVVESNISNVVIVHGCPGDKEKSLNAETRTYDKHWMPWIKRNLEKKKIKVEIPIMPEPWGPDYDNWKKEFEKKVKVNENSVLIGHSCGCAFLVRWLGETKKKIKKLVLVAPWKIAYREDGSDKDFYEYKIDECVRANVGEVVIFTSNDEEKDGKESVKLYEKDIGGRIIELKDHGHFTIGGMGTEEFPELLEEITNEGWPIFTTRPDTIFGITFMVVAAQHSKLDSLITKEQRKDVNKFLKKLKSASKKDVGDLEKEGVFTGSYAVNPANGERVPVWAGNFIVADYGSGMVMAVPAHDQRDLEFAKKYGIEIRQVVAPDKPIRSYLMGAENISDDDLEKLKINIVRKTKEGDREIEIPKKSIKDYEKLIKEKLTEGFWNEYVGREIVFMFKHRDSKIERIVFNEKNKDRIGKLAKEFLGEKKRNQDVLKMLIDNDFYTDMIIHTGSGTLINSGEFDGLENTRAKHNITEWLIKKKLGRKVVNFKLRDWGISRQRYWGTPIPVIHCEKCGAVPVPEKDLPVELPKNVKFGKGNPLETNEKWLSVKCLKCGGNGRRESDTMDTFVNSSWYFMRYCDSKNDKSIFDKKKVEYWCPVNTYIGGAEHACMHLIYSRFYVKFLRDLGLIDFDEPAIRLFHQGMINDEKGEKMSKSKGNVVEPLETMAKYGVDTTRLFLVSVASPDKGFDWSEKGINGSARFTRKIFAFFDGFKSGKDSEVVLSKLNRTIKNVGGYYENFEYRKATIEIRELFDLISSKDDPAGPEGGCSRDAAGKFLQLLSPICPHISEELWEKIGNKGFISVSKWPKVDEKKIGLGGRSKGVGVRDLNGKIADRIKEIVKKDTKKVYVYVMPFEVEKIDVRKIGKAVGLNVSVFAVNDSGKVDPKGMAKRAKPGKAAIYLE